MIGERLGWFRVASHLGIPVGELKTRMAYSEYIDWLNFLSKEEERDTKQDYYLAQIAAEVRRGQVKHPNKIHVKDFLVKMVTQAQAKAAKSKQIWAGAVGIKLKDD